MIFANLFDESGNEFEGLCVFQAGELIFELRDDIHHIYMGIPVTMNEDDEWVQLDTMEPIPDTEQQDIEDEVEAMPRFSFNDFNLADYYEDEES